MKKLLLCFILLAFSIDCLYSQSANAGEDQVVCANTAILSAVDPAPYEGYWQVAEGGTAIIENTSSLTTKVTNLANGENEFIWTVPGLDFPTDKVIIYNNAVQADAGNDQFVCNNTAQLNATDPNPASGVWTVGYGTASFAGGEEIKPDALVTNLSQGNNMLLWTVSITYQSVTCSDEDEVVITNDEPTKAIIAQDDFTTCAETAIITANNPTVGTGSWQVIKGDASIDDNTANTTIARNFSFGENILIWKIVNNQCTSVDSLRVNYDGFDLAPIPNANTNCTDHVSLQGEEPGTGSTGLWTVVKGGGEFDDNTNPQTIVSEIPTGDNIYAWTVTREECSATATVKVVNNSVDANIEEEEIHLCENESIVLHASGGSNYQWAPDIYLNNGTIAKPTITASNVSVDFDFYTKVQISNDQCYDYDSVHVFFYTLPIANAGDDITICEGAAGQLNASGGVQYQWQPQATIDDPAIANPYVNPAQNMTYTVTVVDENGCSASDDVMVTVNNLSVSYQKQDVSVQGGNDGSFSISISGDNPPFTVDWIKPSTGPGSPPYQVDNLTAGTYTVMITDAIDCTVKQDITINEPNDCGFNVDFIHASTEVPNQMGFMVQTDAQGYTAFWELGDGTYSEENEFLHTYSVKGDYEVCLTITDETGCTVTKCKTITVGVSACQADFVYYEGNSSTEIIFEDASQASDGAVRIWDFGEGSLSIGESITNNFDSEGFYEVCLYLYDETSGCFSKKCEVIEIGAECKADFSFFIDSESPNVVNFINQSGGTDAWYWTFGDNSYSPQQAPVKEFAEDGTYEVCLHAFNSENDCISEMCKEVVINTSGETLHNADFAYFINPTDPTDVKFKDRSTGNITERYWDFGDGNFSTEAEPENNYAESGIYKVCFYTYSEETGTYSNQCKEIRVGLSNIQADFSYYYDTETGFVHFKDKSIGNVANWYWTFGDGTHAEGQAQIHETYKIPGMYNVCLQILGNDNISQSKKCTQIQLGQEDCEIKADFIHFIDTETGTVKFTDKSTGGADKWFWDFGNGYSSSNQNAEYTYTKSGTYQVKLSVKNSGIADCSDSKTATVQIGATECVADFDYSIDEANGKYLVVFKNKSQGEINNYYWDFGDGEFSEVRDPEHEFDLPGIHQVSLTVNTKDGTCSDVKKEKIQVGTVTCSAAFDYFVNPDNSVNFRNKILGAATTLYWEFGDGSVSTERHPTHQYTASGYYQVSLSIHNQLTGCIDDYTELIMVNHEAGDCEADFSYRFNANNSEVSFFNLSKGENLSYYWDFNDGTNSVEENPQGHVFDGNKNFYNVCLTAFKDNGIQSTTCYRVPGTSETTCNARFVHVVDSENNMVYFIDRSTGEPDKIYWDFGDGTTKETGADTISHKFNETGYYLVHQTIENSQTACVSDFYNIVNIGENDDFYVEFVSKTSQALTRGVYPTDFIGATAGNPKRVSWDFGDGTKDSTTITPTHNYEEAGLYTVCFKASDPNTGKESNEACQDVLIEASDIDELSGSECLLKTFPNPAKGNMTIAYILPVKTSVEISVYDMMGRKLETLVDKKKSIGKHIYKWNEPGLKSGIYFIEMKTGNQRIIKKISILK